MSEKQTAGQFIEQQMMSKGWTQKQLAAECGIRQQVASLMIRDVMLVSVKQAALLSVGLGVEAARLALIIQSEEKLNKDLLQLNSEIKKLTIKK